MVDVNAADEAFSGKLCFSINFRKLWNRFTQVCEQKTNQNNSGAITVSNWLKMKNVGICAIFQMCNFCIKFQRKGGKSIWIFLPKESYQRYLRVKIFSAAFKIVFQFFQPLNMSPLKKITDGRHSITIWRINHAKSRNKSNRRISEILLKHVIRKRA